MSDTHASGFKATALLLKSVMYGARQGPSSVHLVLSWPRDINLWEHHINSSERDIMSWPRAAMLRERQTCV